MSRRGAGVAKKFGPPAFEDTSADLQLIETPELGAVVGNTARSLIRAGMKPPEVASLMASAAASLAQTGVHALTRDEWLTLCAVLWDGPEGDARVSAPGGEA